MSASGSGSNSLNYFIRDLVCQSPLRVQPCCSRFALSIASSCRISFLLFPHHSALLGVARTTLPQSYVRHERPWLSILLFRKGTRQERLIKPFALKLGRTLTWRRWGAWLLRLDPCMRSGRGQTHKVLTAEMYLDWGNQWHTSVEENLSKLLNNCAHQRQREREDPPVILVHWIWNFLLEECFNQRNVHNLMPVFLYHLFL